MSRFSPTISDLADEYTILWRRAAINASKVELVQRIVSSLDAHKTRYKGISAATGVPWFVVGIIHYSENNFDFSRHLHNSDPLSARTVHAPVGRPPAPAQPPFSWEESAVDALKLSKLANVPADAWSIERIAFELERYDGFRYRANNTGVLSPYLWSFTNLYVKGKYGRDNWFDPNLVSRVVGAMAILKQLIASSGNDEELALLVPPVPPVPQFPVPDIASKDLEGLPLKAKIKGVVPVYFATNRKIAGIPPLALSQITYERSSSSTFGRLLVSVPIVHRIGKTEVPTRNWLGVLEAEDASRHFRVQTISELSRKQFVDALANPADSLMLFIHGYNVSFEDAAFKAAQIAFDANYKGRVMMFAWPSMAALLDYDYDRESALVSSDALFDLLKMIKIEAKLSKMIVIAHSLGSEVLIGAVHQAFLSGIKLGISELIFAASDVSTDLYFQRADQIKAAADNVTLYASSQDWALLASLKKANSKTRMGYVMKSGPTLVDGVETIDVSAVGADMFAINHATFSTSRSVLDDVGRIIMKGEHPPHERTSTLQRMPNEETPTYWMYPY